VLRLAAVPSPTAAPAVAPAPSVHAGVRLRVLGLDPGSRVTGYGVIEVSPGGTRYVASGCIRAGSGELAGRLRQVFTHVAGLVEEHAPDEVAIERVFMHANPDSALKLGQARGAALCAAAGGGASVFEYTPREVKQTVTGTGAADKAQVQHMVKALLGVAGRLGADAADALAIALCHAQHRGLALLVPAR
jgi:crossover junction endodeoxyribonuclease RuvC